MKPVKEVIANDSFMLAFIGLVFMRCKAEVSLVLQDGIEGASLK